MQYLAALDYEHLDNSMFLTVLAPSISKQGQTQPIILHAGSAYTERILQTGVLRDDAQIRGQKDLNHRLVALFADQGVSAVGINGHQRKLIKLKNDKLRMDVQFFNRLPQQSVLVLSSLVWNVSDSKPAAISLTRLSRFLQKKMEIEKLFIFSKSDKKMMESDEKLMKKNWDDLSESFKKEHLPEEFQEYKNSLYLTSARSFQFLPEMKETVFIQ